MGDLIVWVDMVPEAEWEIWYEDRFDPLCPRRMETAGRGLAAGLAELWDRHLFETVRVGGEKGFAHFNLWWKQECRSIQVTGDWAGLIRIRSWVFGTHTSTARGELLGAASRRLLTTIGAAHSCLIVADRTSEAMANEAVAAASPSDFESRLSHLVRLTLEDLDV